jgi:2-polyprenyl-3-methyl-5-hydroxy-6-metoxy-1,4-benzoquinol methylase
MGAVIEMARLGDSATLIDYVIDQAQTKRLNARELSLLARIAAEELIDSKDFNDLENWNTAASLNELLVKLLGHSLDPITEQADNNKTNNMEASGQLARCSSLAAQVEAIRNTLIHDAERRKYLPFGYLKRDEYNHYDDMGHGDQWQKEVYEFAASTARLGQYRKVLDFGCGSASKLMKYFNDFEKIGVELDRNVQELRKRYPSENWIVSRIGEERLPPVDMIICSDVIEHLVDPQTLLEYLEKQDFRILIISTPERELVYSQRDKAERQFLEGPPKNKAHTMEWSYIEFHQMIKRWFKVQKHWISNEAQATQVAMCSHLTD